MGTVAMEEYELMKNSKYRVYVSAVDKALKSFEYTSEWADLISALGKLNKVLLNHLKFPVIPRRIKISKRLAQCMHPALPSGVHLKALETYDIIFKCMGTNRLSHELFIYSAGLFPLLGHAAMNVRPSLLTVYETHFVPLGERLRPGLSGFLSGVLPGLEEGSDHFDRTNCLLEKVCAEVGPSHFYGCLWDCLASNSGIRLPAISFVLSHFNKKLSMEDQLYVMGTNIDIMVNALCSGLQDGSVLVQRNTLDLLLVGFPMHNSQLVRTDMVRLVTAALVTILRRDMSLNRRLFAWLLGSEVNISSFNSEHPLVKNTADSLIHNINKYFHIYSKDMLVQAIKVTLNQGVRQSPHDLRPYRLLVSLLDKPEIGPVILDDILYEVFRTLYLACESSTGCTQKPGGNLPTSCYKGSQELLKSANLLFSTLETCYIWLYTGTLFVNACQHQAASLDEDADEEGLVKPVGSGVPKLKEVCALTEFLLDIVSLETYMDIPSEHLPGLFLQIIMQLTEHCDFLSAQEVARSLHLCAKLLSRVQPSALANLSEPGKKSVDEPELKVVTDVQLEINTCDLPSELVDPSGMSELQPSAKKSDSEKDKLREKLMSKATKSVSSKLIIKPFSFSKNYHHHSTSTPILLSVNNVEMDKNNDHGKQTQGLSQSLVVGDIKQSHVFEAKSKSKSAMQLYGYDYTSKSDFTRSNILASSVSQVPSKQQSVLEKCLRQYEHFFVKFVGGQRIINSGNISKLFNSLLIISPQETENERTTKLETLLNACLHNSDKTTHFPPNLNSRIDKKKVVDNYLMWKTHVPNYSHSNDCEEAMRVASTLLVELSTFPSYCLPAMVYQSTGESSGLTSFPDWLQVLVVCACWLHNVPPLQLVAISTLLDLISLLRSQSDSGSVESDTQGVVSVVMVPLLKHSHVQYIEHHTNVVKVLAHSLWHHLAYLSAEHQVVCVELLHQLHNVLPFNNTVENVIGESLTEENTEKCIEGFQRFSTLWHVGREVETKAGLNKNLRTFDKSLLKMFENLQLPECCPLKLQAQSWLFHSLLRGDISRLLDPLLFMLLDSATARVSVLHVSIEHSNTVLTCARSDAEKVDDAVSSKIYAISSVDGNVIYHVSDSTNENRLKSSQTVKERDSNNPVRAKRIFAVTTLVGGSDMTNHYITEKNTYIKELEYPLPLNRNQNISVFVNPFSNNTNNTSSNDSATEDDSITTSYDKAAPTPLCLKNATRFLPSKKPASDEKQEKAITYLEGNVPSSISENNSVEYIDKCKSSNEITKQNQRHELADWCDSNTTGEFELISGQKWSEGEESLGELEVSTAAEEYFGNSGNSSSVSVVEEILHDVLDTVVNQCMENRQMKEEMKNRCGAKPARKCSTGVGVHPLHSHMLLYCGVYDSHQTLYALYTLRNVLLTNARMFLCAVATTGLTNCTRSSRLLTLLARHRKSVFGRNFHGDINTSSGEFGAAYRSSMYLEVLISVCLYFVRSYYPNLGQMRLTQEEIAGNRQVQLASAELLMLICSELILIVRDSGKGFSCYVADLLSRCKVQKVVLHCLLSSVYNMKSTSVPQDGISKSVIDQAQQRTFTEEIVYFNDPITDNSENMSKCKYRGSEHSEGFQIQLLRLVLALIMLEHQVNSQKGDADIPVINKETPACVPMPTNQLKFSAGLVIPQQPMFLGAILSALKQDHMRHLHQHWTTLVSSSLPFMGQSLTHIVMSVVNQLCYNIKKLATFYGKTDDKEISSLEECCLPADYTVTQLEAMTVLCHYCLLDSTQQLSHAFSQQLLGGTGTMHMGIPGANPGQIFNNLIHVFMPTPLQQDISNKEKCCQLESQLVARHTVLRNLPHIIASVASLWQAIMTDREREQHSCVLGSPRIVKHQTLEFLSPISLHHGINFLAAIAVAWQERKQVAGNNRKVVPVASPDQQVLVYLVGAIRAMPIDTLVQTVHQVVKQPPPVHEAKQDLSLEVSVLELFFCYMQTSSGSQLSESWASLHGLLKDGLTLTPPAQFLMLAILNEFVQKCPPPVEKKDQRDLQDITSKLVESCAQIAGACLEQTTWLRRNLAVREKEPPPTNNTKEKDDPGPPAMSLAEYSVQAQSVLAELLAPLLDVTYGSQEKERVVVLLTGLMYNITPYLKNHSHRNVPSFCACSQLLASLSSYQYTRKAWRRDVFELLLDPALFQMEANCLPYWRTIVDNLMTHDNTTFRDLMNRVSLAQSGSLSIFSSREQEYEQRAQLLKRLAFVILCSETDQYHKYMPEIQERLADSLRLPQVVPSVQAQVFLCFRVLLLRMSPQHVTSLWPIIISEMVQVFLHIEQELSTDTEEFRWSNSNNGLHAHGHPHWLQLELAAAKLLDMAILLPAHRLPQFQMYRWAFVGDSEPTTLNNNQSEDETPRTPEFVPHVSRIARLMDAKFQSPLDIFPCASGQLMLTTSSIQSLQELHPFFTALSVYSPSVIMTDINHAKSELEAVIETDFLDKLPIR